MPADPALPAESADCWAATINKGRELDAGTIPTNVTEVIWLGGE